MRVVASDGLHRAPANDVRYQHHEHSMSRAQQNESDSHALLNAKGTLLGHGKKSARIVARMMVDGAATFDAISPEMATALGCDVEDHPNPLGLSLGGDQHVQIQRRTTVMRLGIPDFPIYEAMCFVMDLPAGYDVLLGTPWHRRINPDIDWDTETIRPRLERVERRGGATALFEEPASSFVEDAVEGGQTQGWAHQVCCSSQECSAEEIIAVGTR